MQLSQPKGKSGAITHISNSMTTFHETKTSNKETDVDDTVRLELNTQV